MQANQSNHEVLFHWRIWLVFFVPSLIGVFLFMTPVNYDGAFTIPIAIAAKAIKSNLAPVMAEIITVIVSLTGVFSLLARIVKPKWIVDSTMLNPLLLVSNVWLAVRVAGMFIALSCYFKWGPEVIHSSATGGLVFTDLMPVLLSVFVLAGLLLPLLLNFGLLEFIGTLLTKVMRPLFGVPGRSAVNCVASWLGDGSVGILMTSKQYEDKYYTQREAVIIGTTFSAVSITFSLVVIGQVKLEHMFAQFYLTVCLAGLVAALIVPRLPPLRSKQDLYIDGTAPDCDKEALPEGKTLFRFSLETALKKAQQNQGASATIREGVHNAMDMVFAVLPVVMAVGTFALVIAEHTPIFKWLGAPFVPYLELLQIPEAQRAAETIVVGFADMFIPSILAASIESDMTRFVIAAMSVTQLIYMSEVGALLLGSKIPVNIFELFIIFVLRTLVTLPVIALMAHLLF